MTLAYGDSAWRQRAQQQLQVGAVGAEQLLAARVQGGEVEDQRQVVGQLAARRGSRPAAR